ncbi:MAG: sulfur carrier protein ThiS [Gammaproteobacteria bacterium]|jgi:sulfur carrier protein|nr:sulfur carrier protein ThiS [Gammaproteobacteria bacterium]MBU2223931.1 sulfur carrier protein ThiS [Gammaproteobacteria bacterium]MBU2277395.1 sulfur carrier protein ThiS [Gammaproteobacteria bacterium]MBU2428873.1 sulfur carrier protein ThiS [Gammaproteobacteria bacterium]
MSEMIPIFVNGEPHQIAASTDLQQLKQKIAPGQQVAIAINTEIMPRRLWAGRTLQPQDQVLMFNLVAGG